METGVPADDTGFDPVRILSVLEAHCVEYLLVGGFAAQAHGARRQTRDLDMMPKTTGENYERLAAALLELNARLRVAGMTDEETHRTGELLLSLVGKHSLIVIEHDMEFVKQIACDGEVTVLHQGSILFEGRFEAVQSDPQVRKVYLGRGK